MTDWNADMSAAPRDGTEIAIVTIDQFTTQQIFLTHWQRHKSGSEGWHVFFGGTVATHWAELPEKT